MWRKQSLKTDETDPQWKQAALDLRIKVTYALSPQAKGKIERPYRWLQDRIVRTCARETVRTVPDLRAVLHEEVRRHNERQVHSTTGEIPMIRLEKAMEEGKSLFRPFAIPFPFQSTRDVFCIRIRRTADGYRRISLDGLQLKVPGVNPYEQVELRMVPHGETGMTEIRFWRNGTLLGTQKIKTTDLKSVRF